MARAKGKKATRSARVIDMKYATLIGTPERLREYLATLTAGVSACVVDLKFSNLVVLDDPITREDIAAALETTPRIQEA